ncbi:hypothetical protein EMCRGX_G029307 [Ephydatia muelleri]
MAETARQQRVVAATVGSAKEADGVPTPAATAATIPSFVPFDATAELMDGLLGKFQTFLGANSVPVEKRAQMILTNQSRVTYKLLSNLAPLSRIHPKVSTSSAWSRSRVS